MTELDSLLLRAFDSRLAHHGKGLVLSAPSFKRFRTQTFPSSGGRPFVAVSTTGQRCALSCEHCKGQLLRGMIPARTPAELVALGRDLKARGTRGMLLSGGSDRQGRVVLLPFLDAIAQVRALGLQVAVHVGVVDRPTAEGLGQCGVDCVMLDVVGHAETARDVLHLDIGPERFAQALEDIVDVGLPVVPHVVLGLHFGRLLGEEEAIRIVARSPSEALVLVVHRPEPGTPMARAEPAPAEDLARLIAQARLTCEDRRLVLGCARPVGKLSRAIEAWALRAGVNGMAFPSDEAVRLARDLGLEPTFVEACCAMPTPL